MIHPILMTIQYSVCEQNLMAKNDDHTVVWSYVVIGYLSHHFWLNFSGKREKTGSKTGQDDIFYKICHTWPSLKVSCFRTLAKKLICGGPRWPCYTGTCQSDFWQTAKTRIFRLWFFGSPHRCLTCREGVLDVTFFSCWWQVGTPVPYDQLLPIHTRDACCVTC